MYAITVFRGDDHTLDLTFDDGTDAIDITDDTIFFTVKPNGSTGIDDSNAIISKTVTDHSDPTNGITQVDLTSSDTNQKIGTYQYDIQRKTAAGSIQTIVKSTFTITDDVTKRTS